MNGVKRLLTSLFLGANLCCLLFLWASCLSTLLPPQRLPLLSLVGLAFPVAVLLNIGFIIFWLIFKARYALLSLVGTLIVASYFIDYCPLNHKRSHPEGALTILSYNVASLAGEGTLDGFTRYVRYVSPDIMCLQEMTPGWGKTDNAKRLLDSLGMKCIRNGNNYIYTRLPIIEESVPTPKVSENTIMACRLAYGDDSLFVFNCHLESNKLSNEDKAEYRSMIKEPHRETVKRGSRNLLSKLSDAAVYRANQTDILCAMADSLQGKSIILCGDLNDTPISYTYQKLSRHLTPAFRKSGFGVGRSFNQRGFPVRIDHIFVSHNWQTAQTHIDSQTDFSDHYPLATFLWKK